MVREIADWLQCGVECWIHKAKGTIHFLPDLKDPLIDSGSWKEVLDDVSGRESEFAIYQMMDHNMFYQVMKDFALLKNHGEVRDVLMHSLVSVNPIKSFRAVIEENLLQEAWVDYLFDANMEWVKSQQHCYELVADLA